MIWISVEDRLPEEWDRVLIWFEYGAWGVANVEDWF